MTKNVTKKDKLKRKKNANKIEKKKQITERKSLIKSNKNG